jgi:hypothetical protein
MNKDLKDAMGPDGQISFAKKSLDMMFIIDSTSSMSPWIEQCKKEI